VDDKVCVVSASGRVLEMGNARTTGGIPVVRGFELTSKKVGDKLASKDESKLKIYNDLMKNISAISMDKITEIDLSSRSGIIMLYDGRITLELGSSMDLDYKLNYFKSVIDSKLSGDFKGKLVYNGSDSGISAIPEGAAKKDDAKDDTASAEKDKDKDKDKQTDANTANAANDQAADANANANANANADTNANANANADQNGSTNYGYMQQQDQGGTGYDYGNGTTDQNYGGYDYNYNNGGTGYDYGGGAYGNYDYNNYNNGSYDYNAYGNYDYNNYNYGGYDYNNGAANYNANGTYDYNYNTGG
jgi:cell division protein FtsQ